MSDAKRIDRRSLFDAFRRAIASDTSKDAPKRGGFSLAAFYDRREETGSEQVPFPRFTLREGLADVETTSTGAGPTQPPPDPPKAPPRGGVA